MRIHGYSREESQIEASRIPGNKKASHCEAFLMNDPIAYYQICHHGFSFFFPPLK